jgi:hypothetical protein
MAHAETDACVRKAEVLLEEGSLDSLRYATLQLRMGIEYLFYELIPHYRDELPDDITTSWQPQKILDALLECDPYVDQDAKIRIGDGPVHQSKAPTKRLLKKHYHRLGSYLHAPVDLVEPPREKWRNDLLEVVSCLREYQTTQIVFNFRPLVEIACKLCERPIRRNKHGVEKTGQMQCLNPACRAIYDIRLEGDKVHYALRQESYTCPYCMTVNYVSIGALVDGLTITCDNCEKRVAVRLGCLEPVDGDPTLHKP